MSHCSVMNLFLTITVVKICGWVFGYVSGSLEFDLILLNLFLHEIL